MKRSSAWVAVVGAVVGLAACGGGSVCDDGESAAKALNEKAAACPSESGATFDKTTCENSLGNCSDADKDALSAYFKCVGDVNACIAGQEDAFESQIVTCANSLGNVSEACLDSFAG